MPFPAVQGYQKEQREQADRFIHLPYLAKLIGFDRRAGMCRRINDQFSMETSRAVLPTDVRRRSLSKAYFMAVQNVLDQQPQEKKKSLRAPSLTNTRKIFKIK